MKTQVTRTLLLVIAMTVGLTLSAQKFVEGTIDAKKFDNRVDNNKYWKKGAANGYARLAVKSSHPPAVFTGSAIKANTVITDNSPDVAVTEQSSTQSENSIFVDPGNSETVLNSNNSTPEPAGTVYGANDLYSFDSGQTWDGEIQGAGGSNSGDPATSISNNGRWFVGYIASGGGQGVSYSDDQGASWTQVTVAGSGGATLDKNHMWIDNSTTSPYEGNLYSAWTPLSSFGSHPNENDIEIKVSDNNGLTWGPALNISSEVNAGSHNQGVNIATGPEGEVYVAWSIYDSWPSDESALGFAKSYDGGVTYEPSVRIIENIRGIRTTETSKNHRVNSYPVMDVDISDGPNRGTIYLTWTNVGVPGVNTGNDIDVYMIKSTDEGETWSDPIKVNQDPSGQGKEHYFPWLCVDPETGVIGVIFYDDRNVASTQCETWCATSYDAGETWEDFKVSDVAFTPNSIPGLAFGYFGDYLAISARGGWFYPCWTDNRQNDAMTFVSPFQVIVVNDPYNFNAQLNDENGEVLLEWDHDPGVGFEFYRIFKNDVLLTTTTMTTFTDQLEDYGIYEYKLVAYYQGGMESEAQYQNVQWGDAAIAVYPTELFDTVSLDGSSSVSFEMYSIGELDLNYTISLLPAPSSSRSYCFAEGGCGEYISHVVFGDIDNATDCSGYGDYTDQSTTLRVGEAVELTITNGNPNPFNKCKVWIDWNQNEDFTDDGEIVISGSPGLGPYTASIIAPPDALDGETRMRIRVNGINASEPCGADVSGEVEDYTVNVINWITIDPISGMVPVNDTTEVSVTADGTKLLEGVHNYLINIANNDPENANLQIPYQLTVVPLFLEISASPELVCAGDYSQLGAAVSGGSGSYTYQWSSEPEGFSSTDQNPSFGPISESTVFTVLVSDGNHQVDGSITVTVNPRPIPDLGPDTGFCQGEEVVLDAGTGFSSYLWQDGSDQQTFIANSQGWYWVQVTNEFNCAGRDSVFIEVFEQPQPDLGGDQSICENDDLILDAGEEYISYLWQDGSTGQFFDVTEAGDYSVMVTDENLCVGYDTITVEINPLPLVELGNDTILCKNTFIILDGGNYGIEYEWNTGENSREISVAYVVYGLGTHAFWVKVTDQNACINTDTVEVKFDDCEGLEEFGKNMKVQIFPNPNDGSFTIQVFSAEPANIDMSIINNNGKIVYKEENIRVINEYMIHPDLKDQPKGLYNLILKEGNSLYHSKILIQ